MLLEQLRRLHGRQRRGRQLAVCRQPWTTVHRSNTVLLLLLLMLLVVLRGEVWFEQAERVFAEDINEAVEVAAQRGAAAEAGITVLSLLKVIL